MEPTRKAVVLQLAPAIVGLVLALGYIALVLTNARFAFAPQNQRMTFFMLSVSLAAIALSAWRFASYRRWRRALERLG